MNREMLVNELRTLREEIARLNGDPWSPAVERSLSLAGMYLHFALWQLGEVEEVGEVEEETPELSPRGRLPSGGDYKQREMLRWRGATGSAGGSPR